MKLLLERGADPVEADAEPVGAPRSWAHKMKRDEVLTVLRKHGGRGRLLIRKVFEANGH